MNLSTMQCFYVEISEFNHDFHSPKELRGLLRREIATCACVKKSRTASLSQPGALAEILTVLERNVDVFQIFATSFVLLPYIMGQTHVHFKLVQFLIFIHEWGKIKANDDILKLIPFVGMDGTCRYIRNATNCDNQALKVKLSTDFFGLDKPFLRPTTIKLPPNSFLGRVSQQRRIRIQNMHPMPHPAEEGVLAIYQVDSNVLRVSDFSIFGFRFDAYDLHHPVNYFAPTFVAKIINDLKFEHRTTLECFPKSRPSNLMRH
mmetsp:Transcript_4830/g.8070  ORF Transcript_4830/g.8070 Transcript_4830/m.8070 type:complete len:261 (+) Transcript_4830:102-884(+)